MVGTCVAHLYRMTASLCTVFRDKQVMIRREGRGDQLMTGKKSTKTLIGELVRVGVVRPSGWGSRNHLQEMDGENR